MSGQNNKSSNVVSMMNAADPLAYKVTRSAVPTTLEYKAYKRYLRKDFLWSCAYCTIMESEAQAVRMVIDHYEPVILRPDLSNVYVNLMYACDPCNARKGDRCPPLAARVEGHRFFRPDEDIRIEHFTLNGVLIESETNVGRFTIDFLDLNRRELQRIRGLRYRLLQSSTIVNEGIMALRSLPRDQIAPELRARANRVIEHLVAREPDFVEDIDELLRAYASSPLIDDDELPEDAAAKKARLERMGKTQGMFPGAWSGRRKKATRKK
jgi:hypothetical protein